MADVTSSSNETKRSLDEANRLAIRASQAQLHLAQLDQETVDNIIEHMASVALENSDALAEAAVTETGYGIRADKAKKNKFAAETIYNFIRPMKTVGVIRRLESQRVIEIAEPFGVVAAVIPSTNPTSTAIYKLLIAIKARCAIVLSPHPAAINCISKTAELLNGAALEAGAPKGAINWMTTVTLDATQALMKHRDVAVILATGGMGLVRAAYSAGKPAYGVGPGNAPAYIERSADVRKAVRDIVTGKTFDNGLLCSSENSVVVDEAISEAVRDEFRENGGYFLNSTETAALSKVLVTTQRLPHPDFIGRTALKVATKADIKVPQDTKVLLAALDGVGREYPLSIEKLCPVLSYYVVENWRAGCEKCKQILSYGGMGHTMSIHSRDDSIILEFGLKKPASRIVVNTPATLGSIGMTTDLDPSMTLGCGGYGGNITSDNISPRHLLNVKRLAYETSPVAELSDKVAPVSRRPLISNLPSRAVADSVAVFLQSRNIRPESNTSNTTDHTQSKETHRNIPKITAMPDKASVGNSSPSPIDFVAEDDVRLAINESRSILIDQRTIVTPSARDLAERHNVFVEY